MAEQFLARCEFSASRHEVELEYTVVEILLEILFLIVFFLTFVILHCRKRELQLGDTCRLLLAVLSVI